MAVVYVLGKDGKPLMPTTRCGHVRVLLKENKARVVERKPFTIQLLYDTQNITQSLYLGIDPGRTNIGLAVVKETGEPVMLVQAETRNKEIPKLMTARKAFRQAHRKHRREKRQRRAMAAGTVTALGKIQRLLPGYEKPVTCKVIKNKEVRFNNRLRPEKWLTPTANHLFQTHLNLVKKLQRCLPITDIVLELNHFDFMAMDNPHIKKWQYQKGPLFEKSGIKAAVFDLQEGHCIFCKNPIEHYHHVVPRHKNGSETLANRAGLCTFHHDLVHTEEAWAKKLAEKKTGLNKQYHALSVLNQIIPYLVEELFKLVTGHVYTIEGFDTKEYRITHKVDKDHYLDAYCIACTPLDVCDSSAKRMKPYHIQQFRRHDRQACHQQRLNRVYLLDGKPVATNRHKATEQKTPSLEEYTGAKDNLTVKPHHPIYKNMNRTLPGALISANGKLKTLAASTGVYKGNPAYYHFADGSQARFHQCTKIQNNKGLIFT